MSEVQGGVTNDFPTGVAGLEEALRSTREYTLALYADLPAAWWSPAAFPHLRIVNPPLWELSHIAWFAEFFCLRWRADDPTGSRVPCSLVGGDELFDSARVPHAARWTNTYPSRAVCMDYMRSTLEQVIAALRDSSEGRRYFFQLVVAHELMHAEALAMTLNTLGLPLPGCVPPRRAISGPREEVRIAGRNFAMGTSDRTFKFDNEQPPLEVAVATFSIDTRVVSAREFAEFANSPAYTDEAFWSEAGRHWRADAGRGPRTARADQAAMHVSYHEAEAWCRWAGRRLPSEAEWELAAVQSEPFRNSAGVVWEWTSSSFGGHPGFEPGPYRDYSAPWFGDHMVLRGGSFATNALLRYPQYRNFYQPHRSDMFCGFRSCALS